MRDEPFPDHNEPDSPPWLAELVMPAVEPHVAAGDGCRVLHDGDKVEIVLQGRHKVRFQPLAADDGWPLIQVSWLACLAAGDCSPQVTTLGLLLAGSCFSIRPDLELFEHGELRAGTVVPMDCESGKPLSWVVTRLVNQAGEIDRILMMRCPQAAHWSELEGLEVPWGEIANADLRGMLREARRMPAAECNPRTLVMAARWL